MFGSSVKDWKARECKERLKNNNVFTIEIDEHLVRTQKFTPADGFVHPSSLNWNSKPETQVKKLLTKRRQAASLLRIFRLGDLIHEDIQSLLSDHCFVKTYIERHIEVPKIFFRGTPDLLGKHKILGSVLLELKSISKYQKDRKKGDVWFNDIWKTYSNLNETDKFSDVEWEEIYERVCTGEYHINEPKSEHLTQAFTYAWVLGLLKYPIDYVCIGYVRKDTYQIVEFWYNVLQSKELIEKAGNNYIKVMKLLRKEWKELSYED